MRQSKARQMRSEEVGRERAGGANEARICGIGVG